MADIEKRIFELFMKLRINRNFRDFLNRTLYLQENLGQDEKIAVRYEDPDDKGIRGQISEKMRVSVKKGDQKTDVLSLGSDGQMTYSADHFKSYDPDVLYSSWAQ